MKKILSIILLLSMSLFAAQKPAQKVVLQLSWMHQYQFAGYYIAKELGYYEDVGIDLEINEFKFGMDILSVIETKKADFAIGRSSLLIDKANGKDVVALGAIFQSSPLMLMTRADTGINSINDLKGKRIMLTDDAKKTASIMAMLFSHGLLKKDIHVVHHSFNLNDLIDKKIDAMGCYMSNEPIIMADKGIDYKIFHPKEYGFNFYSDILFTSSKFIKKKPKFTKDFYEASIKGWEYAFEHITQTAELIHKKYNTQNKTLIQLIKEGEVLKQLSNSNNKSLGYLSKEQLKDIVKVYKLLGLIDKDIDLESFIYKYNHPKEFFFSLSYDDIFHIIIIFLFLFVLSASALLFISLRIKWLHTKRYLNNQIQEQKQKIEKQNRTIMAQAKMTAVGDMLSNIAHQWRQPLNIITLNITKLETAMLFSNKINNEEITKVTQAINEQSQYLSSTIDDFRNYFVSRSDMLELFKISDVIENLDRLTKDIFTHNNIEKIETVDECSIKQNKSLLIQALLNIYNNSKDAIIQDDIQYKYFFVEVTCSDNNAIIKLKDSAGGIDDNVISKIFDPYYTTKQEIKGTGLGLYITYEIITKHFNGSIEVHNTDYSYMGHELSGAEFIITIPIT